MRNRNEYDRKSDKRHTEAQCFRGLPGAWHGEGRAVRLRSAGADAPVGQKCAAHPEGHAHDLEIPLQFHASDGHPAVGGGRHRAGGETAGACDCNLAGQHHQRRVQLLAGVPRREGDRSPEKAAARLCAGAARRPGTKAGGGRSGAGRRDSALGGRPHLGGRPPGGGQRPAGKPVHAHGRVEPCAQEQRRGPPRRPHPGGDAQHGVRRDDHFFRNRQGRGLRNRLAYGVRQNRQPDPECEG